MAVSGEFSPATDRPERDDALLLGPTAYGRAG